MITKGAPKDRGALFYARKTEKLLRFSVGEHEKMEYHKDIYRPFKRNAPRNTDKKRRTKMIGLGIDTGGTYTDAVIYDMEKGEILASGKTLTSKGDLKVGIKNTLMELPEDLMRKCGMIALSTTLATNAAVEGRGGKGKLILLGASKSIFHQNYQKYGFDNVDDVYIADCGIKMNPAETREPDWDAFEADMRTFLADCECAAVCQLHAKRNNSQQEQAYGT